MASISLGEWLIGTCFYHPFKMFIIFGWQLFLFQQLPAPQTILDPRRRATRYDNPVFSRLLELVTEALGCLGFLDAFYHHEPYQVLR